MVHSYHGLEPDSKSASHYLFTLLFIYQCLRHHFCWSLFIAESVQFLFQILASIHIRVASEWETVRLLGVYLQGGISYWGLGWALRVFVAGKWRTQQSSVLVSHRKMHKPGGLCGQQMPSCTLLTSYMWWLQWRNPMLGVVLVLPNIPELVLPKG